MLKENASKIAWAVIVLCFIVLTIIGQIKIKEQNQVSEFIETRKNIQQNTEENFVIDENNKINGIISAVFDEEILVVDINGISHSIKMKDFKNYRTRESIDISKINVRRLL